MNGIEFKKCITRCTTGSHQCIPHIPGGAGDVCSSKLLFFFDFFLGIGFWTGHSYKCCPSLFCWQPVVAFIWLGHHSNLVSSDILPHVYFTKVIITSSGDRLTTSCICLLSSLSRDCFFMMLTIQLKPIKKI